MLQRFRSCLGVGDANMEAAASGCDASPHTCVPRTQDLWIPTFVIVTNISTTTMEVAVCTHF